MVDAYRPCQSSESETGFGCVSKNRMLTACLEDSVAGCRDINCSIQTQTLADDCAVCTKSSACAPRV